MLKVAWVMESLGWSDKRGQTEALPAVLPVPRRDTRGAREKVDEAGRREDAVVLRKAAGRRERISSLAEPEPPSTGAGTRRG